MDVKVCQAPWGCSKKTAKASGGAKRSINNLELCRGCYQYAWENAKELGQAKEDILPRLDPPKKPLPRISTICAREECGVRLRKNSGPEHRRTIGLHHLCRNCYQATWELCQKLGISLEDAFKQMKPKGWTPPEPEAVSCCLPWCDSELMPVAQAVMVDEHYACGRCRAYLKAMAKRIKRPNRTWQQWGVEAIKGNVTSPGNPEECVMPWCNRVEVIRRYGPNGEPICNTDSLYLYLYARRKGISRSQAFQTAPIPRLVHTKAS
jgi:hypothetical protein